MTVRERLDVMARMRKAAQKMLVTSITDGEEINEGVYPSLIENVWISDQVSIPAVQIFTDNIQAVAKRVHCNVISTKTVDYFVYDDIAFFKSMGGDFDALHS